jgi:hypothetical protein
VKNCLFDRYIKYTNRFASSFYFEVGDFWPNIVQTSKPFSMLSNTPLAGLPASLCFAHGDFELNFVMNDYGDVQGVFTRLKRKMTYHFNGFYSKGENINLTFVIDWVKSENENMFTAFSGRLTADTLHLKWMLTYETQNRGDRPVPSARIGSSSLRIIKKNILPHVHIPT